MQGYNFTERMRRVLARARGEAVRLRHEYVGTEHLLLGLLGDGEGVAAAALHNLGVDRDALRAMVENTVRAGSANPHTGPDLPYTSRAKKVLELAMSEARELNHSYVGTEHLLLGLVGEQNGIAAQALAKHRVDVDGARREILRLLGGTPDQDAAELPPSPLELGGGGTHPLPVPAPPVPPCSKCGGAMHEGFVLGDPTRGYSRPGEWFAGTPESSLWSGTKTRGRPRHPIATYRCERCGFLEWYARGA